MSADATTRGQDRLAGPGGTHLVDRDPNQHAPLLLHGAAVLVPVGMLPADATVVVDQPLHRLRQRNDLRRPLDLHPAVEESVREHAQDRGPITSQIARLVGTLPGRDDHLPLAVDPGQHGRGLQSPTGPAGDEHCPVVACDELSRVVWAHTLSSSAELSWSGCSAWWHTPAQQLASHSQRIAVRAKVMCGPAPEQLDRAAQREIREL